MTIPPRLVVASYNIRYARGPYLISGGLRRKLGLMSLRGRPEHVGKMIRDAADAFSAGKLLPAVDVLALQEADLLGEFWTCLNWNPDSSINHVLPDRWRDQFARRTVPESVRPFVHTRPAREIGLPRFTLVLVLPSPPAY